MERPLVSIIIPAYNEGMVIERLLKSIKGQTYKNIEIIVVDDGSSDKTFTLAKKYTDKVYKKLRRSERSATRNFGASKSKGKYLFFLDADMELTSDVVSACIKKAVRFKKVGGIVIPEESIANTFWEKVKAYERSFYNLKGDYNIEAARFFNRSIYDKAGGYDETVTGPEDWLLPETIRKKGYQILRVDNTYIYHHERIKNIFSLAKKKYYYGLKSRKYLSKTNLSPFNEKTIYFLRPAFYKNWKRLVTNPFMSTAMIIMLSVEQIAGITGYVHGYFKK